MHNNTNIHMSTQSITSTDEKFTNRIALVALNHYDTILPTKGKPKDNEWTVYAAIVASRRMKSLPHEDNTEDLWVVSCATGTKCCALQDEHHSIGVALRILQDSHAEVLARRGLLRVLWNEIQMHRNEILASSSVQSEIPIQKRQNHRTILVKASAPERSTNCKIRRPNRYSYRLDPDIDLHMYISDSPCGDASIYAVQLSTDQLQFTGAKVIVSEQTDVTVQECGGAVLSPNPTTDSATIATLAVQLVREKTQLTGKLRTKSGRSNLQAHLRSTSMSCSDKLVRWSVLGLQGTVLSQYIVEPIRLNSLIVGKDSRANCMDRGKSQEDALIRAITNRVIAVRDILSSSQSKNDSIQLDFVSKIKPPKIFITEKVFSFGKSERATNRKVVHDENESLFKKRKWDNIDATTVTKASTAGLSLNWHLGNKDVEITVGVRGIQNGKKPKSIADYCKLQSCLCRKVFLELALQSTTTSPHIIPSPTTSDSFMNDQSTTMTSIRDYSVYKRSHGCPIQEHMRAFIFEHGPLAGWIYDDRNDIKNNSACVADLKCS